MTGRGSGLRGSEPRGEWVARGGRNDGQRQGCHCAAGDQSTPLHMVTVPIAQQAGVGGQCVPTSTRGA